MTTPSIFSNTYDFLRGRGFWLTIAGLTTLGLAAPVSMHFQDGRAASSVPAKEAKEKKSDNEKKPAKDISKYIEQLGSADFDARDGAMDKLRDLGAGALKALDEAGENHTDAEVRWNARRLAREIRSGETPKVRKLKDLDNMNDNDSSPAVRPKIRQGQGGGIRIEIPDMQDLLEQNGDMNKQMEDLNKYMESLREQMKKGGAFVAPFRVDPNSQFQSFSNGTSVQMGPDGVKVTITEENKDGEKETKTYEAPSMEEFKEKYPEIAEKHLNGMHIFGSGGRGNNIFKFETAPLVMDPQTFNRFQNGFAQAGPASSDASFDEMDYETVIGADNGERLGVEVRPVPLDVAKFLKLKTNHGFMVHSVSDDGQAAELGMQENDVVVSVNGKKIGAGGSPLREVLANIPAGESLKVVVVRGMEGQKTLEGKKLATSAKDKKAEKDKKKSK